MRPKIAIFGGSFNPPGTHHRDVAKVLIPHFDRIIVLPCGPRPDKPTTNDVDPWHRASLADIAFKGLPKVEVDLSDLELASFTTNDQFETRYGEYGEVWHVIGSDLSVGGGDGNSVIQRQWDGGSEMWQQLHFCVVAPQGYRLNKVDLPPKHMVLEAGSGASSEIREKIFKREPYADLVPANVAAYIERYGLYRGRIPARRTRWQFDHPRLLIVADEYNPRALTLADIYRSWEDTDDPNCILTLGGDGTMLRAIRQHWRRRVPFLGVNQGHLGFLLNEPDALLGTRLPEAELIVRQMPMLFVEIETLDGISRTDLAFNDAWIERSTSQSAWIEVTVNGQVRIPKMVADGALVSTAAGSTAYARSMGVAPLLADTPGWLLVGSNVMYPAGWKSALLAPEATVSLRSVGGDKRRLSAFVGGRDIGAATALHVRQSRIATAELVFALGHDMAEKISQIQFPPIEAVSP
jgi:NAD kinase/nicotinic acid mononucleotide adenylyltransferase